MSWYIGMKQTLDSCKRSVETLKSSSASVSSCSEFIASCVKAIHDELVINPEQKPLEQWTPQEILINDLLVKILNSFHELIKENQVIIHHVEIVDDKHKDIMKYISEQEYNSAKLEIVNNPNHESMAENIKSLKDVPYLLKPKNEISEIDTTFLSNKVLNISNDNISAGEKLCEQTNSIQPTIKSELSDDEFENCEDVEIDETFSSPVENKLLPPNLVKPCRVVLHNCLQLVDKKETGQNFVKNKACNTTKYNCKKTVTFNKTQMKESDRTIPDRKAQKNSISCNEPRDKNKAFDHHSLNSNENLLKKQLKEKSNLAKNNSTVCLQCGKTYRHSRYLKRHVLKVHCVDKPHVCSTCKTGFASSNGLQKHKLRYKGHKCSPKLGKIIPRKLVKCLECGKKFSKAGCLKRHKVKVHGDTYESSYVCDTCGKWYPCKRTLDRHVTCKHTEKPRKEEVLKERKIKLTCSECGKTFRSFYKLREHKVVHTGEKRYICHVCGKSLAYQDSLKMHLRTHNDAFKAIDTRKIFMCDRCNKTLCSQASYNYHMKDHQLRDENIGLTCDICIKESGKSDMYITASRLYYHRQVVHKGILRQKKGLICKICGILVYGSYNLQIHMSRHNDEKPHVCKHCQKCFHHIALLRVHMICHNKKFACEICGKFFPKMGHLQRHINSHNKEYLYQCSFCDKRLISKYNLGLHERIHTGDKRYKCRYCDKAFVQNNAWKIHEKTHMKEKIYEQA